MTEPLFTDAEMAEDRLLAESLMTIKFNVFAPTGNGWVNVNGVDVLDLDPQGQTFGKVQRPGNRGKDTSTRTITIDSVERPVLEAGLHIPINATIPVGGLERGDGWEYECAELGPSDDPALLGRRYMVVNVPAKSFASARRLDVVDITGQPTGGA